MSEPAPLPAMDLSDTRITQAQFYERLIERQYCLVRLSACSRPFVAKVCWEDVYALGLQPAVLDSASPPMWAMGLEQEHREALSSLGLYAGQTSLVMKKALVSVTPIPGGKINGAAGGPRA